MNVSPASPPRTLLILLCVSVPSFMINLDANIVSVSLPSIARALHADFAAIEWVISAYTLAFASLVLPAGMLADRYGRKRILIAGVSLFTAASLVCGAASSVAMLNAARAMQGVGAALLLSAALAILSNEFHGPARASAFAFWGSVIGIAITLGPIAGGVITQTLGWEWAFYINVPIGLVMIALTRHAVTESYNRKATGVDIPGFLSFASALFLLTLALISGNHKGWTSPAVIAEVMAAALLFAAFLLIEARRAEPMLDLRFFRRATYVGANIANLAYAAALLTMLSFLPLYFQAGFAVTPTTAGMMMLPMAVPLFIVPRLVAHHLNPRVSGRALLTAGLGLVSLGLVWMAMTATQFDYRSMLAGILIAGTGAGILNGEVAKVSMSVIPSEQAGMGAGVGGAGRFTGLVVGFAALGAVLSNQVTGTLRVLLPGGAAAERFAIAQRVMAGDLPGAAAVKGSGESVALTSFGAGYQAVFATAALVAILAAAASWWLVRAADTLPTARRSSMQPIALPVE